MSRIVNDYLPSCKILLCMLYLSNLRVLRIVCVLSIHKIKNSPVYAQNINNKGMSIEELIAMPPDLIMLAG